MADLPSAPVKGERRYSSLDQWCSLARMAERKSWQPEVLGIIPLVIIIIILYLQPHTVRFAQYPHQYKIFSCISCTIADLIKQTAVFSNQ
ncbi:hypothetical protein [Gibbsiella dentisursi]|uniref:hypothetical protein n=1 Tax=Gibbsiella dentisursi TaxID=796890 RepID=UPI0031FA39F0